MNIIYYKKMQQAPNSVRLVVLKAEKEYTESIIAYRPRTSILMHWDTEVLVAYESDEKSAVLGFLGYNLNEDSGSCSISLAWVEPLYRRMGVHTALFEDLVTRMQKAGANRIGSSVALDNTAAQRAFQKQGRFAVLIDYTYLVEPMVAKQAKSKLDNKSKIDFDHSDLLAKLKALRDKRYLIKPGDTLSQICEWLYGDDRNMRSICTLNKISDPDFILEGETLRLP